MTCFVDTNVIIGYCFAPDMHHIPAVDFVNSKNELIASVNVIDEWDSVKKDVEEKKIDKISESREKIRKECLSEKIKNIDQIEDYFNNYVSDFLFEIINEKFDFPIKKMEILRYLRTLSHELESIPYIRYDEIQEKIEIHKREDEYPKEHEKLSEIGIHSRNNKGGDREILLDCHDCSNNTRDIIFVTTDGELNDTKKTEILEILTIEDIRELRSFN
ncbi:PIN family nuclease [Methanonatronarchaeum thermophilum]|uniref:PIN family nuclease n=1 Tax=Methanonatronarchaeum thermophilum TaxID=1927129 RepID=A0A1Y3GBT0_9EURY|nr:hypothetical protein [Methanonatronarchaeum thermophilum]OUJ18869.1 PIN family nuclease [Methanonatronarchaeum thermophilum]